MSNLGHAIEAVRRGFSVFPCVHNAKTPAIKDWPNRATTDLAQIKAWWAEDPFYNIGGSTTGKLVLDLDVKNGGGDSFRGLLLIYEFPKTMRTETASGGDHIVFAMPPHNEVSNSAGRIAPGIDVRGDGGYIVLPGSSIGGRTYKWMNDNPPAAAPEEIVALCKARQPKSEAAGKRLMPEDDESLRLSRQYLDSRAPTEVAEGRRDSAGYEVAARLYDFAVERSTCHELLTEWSGANCGPPLDDEALDRISRSGECNRANAIGCSHPGAPGFDPVDIAPRPGPPPSKFLSIAAAEGARIALDRRGRYLVKGLLDCGGMSVLYGESGGGKTFMAQDLAYHVGKGAEWRGHKVRQGGVIYLAAEGGSGTFARLAALQAHYGPLDDVRLHLIPVPADFIHGPGDVDLLLAEIQRVERDCGYKVELVIVDTLSRAMAGGDENSSVDMGAMVKALDRLRLISAAHVLTVHHTGKDKAKGARGHSLLRAATDTEIEVDNRILTVTKQRDMESDLTMPFRLVPIPIGIDADGDTVTSCFVEIRIKGDFPAEPQPLTEETRKFAGALREWVTTKDDTNNMGEIPFRTRQAIQCAGSLMPKNAHAHSDSGTGLKRAVGRMLIEMRDSAHVRQVSMGKWVFRNAQNAQNTQNETVK